MEVSTIIVSAFFGIIIIGTLIILIVLTIQLWMNNTSIKFKLEDHPEIMLMVETIKNEFVEKYQLPIFYLSDAYLNRDVEKPEERANGMYRYVRNGEYKKVLKEYREAIKELLNSGLPYPSIEHQKYYEFERLLPRVEIVVENEYTTSFKSKKLAQYMTTFHEFGHHLIEVNGEEQTEERASELGITYLKDRLPKWTRVYLNYSYEVYGLKTEQNRCLYYFLKYKISKLKPFKWFSRISK
jgi:hypothetical protein